MVAAASAAVSRPRLTGHLPVVAADHRPRTARLPAVAVAAASVAVLAVEPLLRATERLLRLIAHPLRAMGHRRAEAVAVAVAGLPLAMERLVPAATVVAVDLVAVDIPVAVERRPLRTVHLREVAADIPAVAEDHQRLMVPHPVVADSEAGKTDKYL